MIDLIRTKDAIEAIKAIPPGNWAAARYVREIENVPSVEAVPLDKLCEYLNTVIYPCIICKESPGPQCNAKRKGCWYRVLTKWMEEQNASD